MVKKSNLIFNSNYTGLKQITYIFKGRKKYFKKAWGAF